MTDLNDGVLLGLAEEEYHKIERVNNTALGQLARSPAHLQASLTAQPEPKSAYILGSAFHCAALTPDLFETTYVRGPEGDRRTKLVRDEWNDLRERWGYDNVLRPADYDNVRAMAAKVQEHSVLQGVAGNEEVTILWTDSETGIKLKGRVDFLPESNWIVDLKSTTDASPKAFRKSIWAYGYYRQMALYLMGLEALGEAREYVCMLAVETAAPWAVGAYRLDEGALSAGEQEARRLLRLYAQCEAAGVWPAYTEEIVDITLPPWAWSEIPEDPNGDEA